MMAVVDCSGWSWKPSLTSTPMRSALEELDHLGVVLEVAGRPGSPRSSARPGTSGGTGRSGWGRPRRRSPAPRGCGGASTRPAPRPSPRRGRAGTGTAGTRRPANSRAASSDTREPHGDHLEAGVVLLAGVDRAEEVAMHSHGSSVWRGKAKRIRSVVRLSSVQMTRSSPSALAAKWPQATWGTSSCSALALASSSRRQARDPVLEGRVVLAALGPEAPLVAEERRLVEVGGDVVDGHALGHPAAEERRREQRVVVGHLGRPGRQGLAPGARLLGGLLAQLALARTEVAAAEGRAELRVVLARLRSARPGGPWCAGPRRRPCRRRGGRRRPCGGRARRRCGSGRRRPG